jgi:hypothetical protein
VIEPEPGSHWERKRDHVPVEVEKIDGTGEQGIVFYFVGPVRWAHDVETWDEHFRPRSPER